MKTMISVGALALALLGAQPALAHDDDTDLPPLLHPGAALMNEHMHGAGEVMIGLRFVRSRSAGENRAETDPIADPAIAAAGYTVRTRSMTMDMVMLDLMYAPSDDLTLMIMPHYMRHRMEMVGIDSTGGAGHGGHGEHTLGFGQVYAHSAEGFGDTLVSASYRLAREPRFGAHATLGVWAPTGSVSLKNPDGTFVHYGMQPGGGTWDLEPSLTVTGRSGPLGWGAQAGYRWRTEAGNASGFAFGDRAWATGWLNYLIGDAVQATGRLEFVHEGQIQGHYNGPHRHHTPADRQENYGGDFVTAAFALNWALPVASGKRPQLAAELGVPLYQDVKGIQAPRKWALSLALSQAF